MRSSVSVRRWVAELLHERQVRRGHRLHFAEYAGIWVGAIVLIHLVGSTASAQLRGRVVDAEGGPVPGVAVETWSPVRQLGVRVSDDDGTFRFTREEVQEVSGIIARRVGWKTARLRVISADTLLRVSMEPQPETLDGLSVKATRIPACPNREAPRARGLWLALRDQYQSRSDTSSIATFLSSIESIGPREEVGLADTAGTARRWIKSLHAHRLMWARIISTRGYGYGITESTGEAYAAWQYPPLESYYLSHFAEDLFGERHTLSIIRESSDEVVLRYCPRERSNRGQRIEGTLTFASDGALLQATWKYLTPRPQEDAGGEIDFTPPSASFRPALLLPARSVYWRRTTGGRYYQRLYYFSEWRVVGYGQIPDWEDLPS